VTTDAYTIAGELPWRARCLLARAAGTEFPMQVVPDMPKDRESLRVLQDAGLINDRYQITESGFPVYVETCRPIPLDCAHLYDVRFENGEYHCGLCEPQYAQSAEKQPPRT